MVPSFNVTDTLQTKYVQTFNNEITSYITASGQVVLGYINSDLSGFLFSFAVKKSRNLIHPLLAVQGFKKSI